MEEYKVNLLKNLLRAFEKECKDLGFKYFIAVSGEIRIHAHPLYLAHAIMEGIKGLPADGRQSTITLLCELLEEEIEE